MKIYKKEFNKLKQLDRIEYRQRFNLIKEEFKGKSFLMSILYLFIFIGGFLILLIPQFYLAFGLDNTIFLMKKIQFFTNFGIPIIIFALIIDVILYFIERDRIKKLNEEYFQVIKKK